MRDVVEMTARMPAELRKPLRRKPAPLPTPRPELARRRAAIEFVGDRMAMANRLLGTARALGDKQMERRILETMHSDQDLSAGEDRRSPAEQEQAGSTPRPPGDAGG